MRECENAGKQMYRLAEEIFPIFRCLTGKGVSDTLAIPNDYYHKAAGYSFEIKEIASRTPVFDWKVPKEWIIRESYIEDENGEHDYLKNDAKETTKFWGVLSNRKGQLISREIRLPYG